MDLNQLYFDHQIALMRAFDTRDLDIRDVHLDNAAVAARDIELFQKVRSAPAFSRWEMRYRSDDQPRPSERMPRIRAMQ